MLDDNDVESNDGLEIAFPIEFFIVDEVPLSWRAEGKARWQQKVTDAAQAVIKPGSWATNQPVSVTILYFPDGPMAGDIDNIVEPILDAMQPFVYLNDRQVERVWAQRFEEERPRAISDPTTTLAAALEYDPPVLYVRVDDDSSLR